MAKQAGDNPECLRCKRGPSYHGGHTRSDPRCVLHGCSSEDVKGVQAFLRQKQIDDAVQDFLTGGDDPMPPQTLAAPATRGSPESTRLCQKCLKGEASHHKHDPLADNCILYGVDDPTPAKARKLLLEREIALARDEAQTAAAMSSPTTTSPPPSPPPLRPKSTVSANEKIFDHRRKLLPTRKITSWT